MAQGIGLFGGSFDPIHFGHLISARSLAEQLSLDRVVLIPSGRPPHKREAIRTDPAHRLEMTRRAVEGDPLFEVSDVELRREGPSYTFDTVTEFRRRFGGDAELCWFIGADWLAELPTWYRIADLAGIVRFVAAARPGWKVPPREALDRCMGPDAVDRLLADCRVTPLVEISATDIRARVRSGRSIRYLVPERVRSYIMDQRLYHEA